MPTRPPLATIVPVLLTLGAGQGDRAARRRDRAFVAHLAALRRRAGLDRGEAVAAGEEVAVGDRQARGRPARRHRRARWRRSTTPYGLTRKIFPFDRHLAEDVRRVVAGDAVERAPRCSTAELKRTFSPLAIEKLFQSMIALWVVWLMTWLVGRLLGDRRLPGDHRAALRQPPAPRRQSRRQIAKLSGCKAKERRRRSAVRAILVGRFFIRRSLGLLVRRQLACLTCPSRSATRRQNVLLARK